MRIDWPMMIVLCGLSLPGIFLAMPRLISLLLQNNSVALQKRAGGFAIIHTFIMVFAMSFAGEVLSSRTGLDDPVLRAILQGKASYNSLIPYILPILGYSFLGLMIFCGLYYGVVYRLIDEKSFQILQKMRAGLKIDGCILYGGVVDEVIARWGLMNIIAFFLILFTRQSNSVVIWSSIVFSGLVFGVGQIPVYIAAGCSSTRQFIYSILMLYVWQSVIFGYVFWKYGILSAILAHMLFHMGWALYETNKI